MYQSFNKKSLTENTSQSGSSEKRKGVSKNNRHNQAAQLQEIANTFISGKNEPIQRMINVKLAIDRDDKKKITAKGKVKDFIDGSSAGNTGWLGVEKYRARYRVWDKKYENDGEVGPLQNSFTNPEAGHVLGRQNGGNGGDPENIFAQDGGTNNGIYKGFENDMRKDLNKYKPNDNAEFVAYLVGEDIEEGNISNAGLGYASDISSSEDDSSDEDMD